jgi:hypothetical protein
MTHQRDGNRHEFDCDGPRCTEAFAQVDGDDADFWETWAAARLAGWISFKKDGEWVHLCPRCRGRVGG